MATASLDAMHTACVRLRDSLDRWLAAFEVMAHEAAVSGVSVQKTEPARKTLRSQNAVQITALAGQERGVTAAEIARVLGVPTRSAHGRLAVLATRGHLVRVAPPGQTVRFFAHAEHAAAWAVVGGPPALETTDAREALQVGMPHQLSDMVADAASAVEKAMAVLAPAPTAPEPAPYIPPTPSRARGERREQLTAAAYVAPVAKPTGEPIVPPTAKITRAPTPVDKRFYVDPTTVAQDGESFSAQWKRLRGEGSQA